MGKHLLVEVSGCSDARKFINPDAVEELFTQILLRTNLKALGSTAHYVFPLDISRKLDQGLTSIQVLTTSHQSFHSCTENGGYSYDLYSCVDFDHNDVLDVMESWIDDDYAKISSTIIIR